MIHRLLIVLGFITSISIPPSHAKSSPSIAEQEVARLEDKAYWLHFNTEWEGKLLLRDFHNNLLETDWQKQAHLIEVESEEQLERWSKRFTLKKLEDKTRLKKLFSLGGIVGSKAKSIDGYSCYQTVEETFSLAQELAANNQNLVSWTDIGDSQQKVATGNGYDLMVLTITDKTSNVEKARLFLTGAIHAREYATAPLLMRFAQSLISGFSSDADIQQLLKHNEVHLLLQSNPDGRKKAETGISWRKNVNTNYCGNSNTLQGADLNRNFSFKWNTVPNGSSGDPCQLDYRGPAPASEAETIAIEDYVQTIFDDYRDESNDDNPANPDAMGLHIDVHSYGELILWPWGDSSSPAPNRTPLESLGRKFASFNNYTPIQSAGLYPTDGTSDGPSYGQLGIASYTFEIGTAFFQDCGAFEQRIAPDNLKALTYALRVSRAPYQLALGADVLSLAVNGQESVTIASDTQLTLSGRASGNLGTVQGLSKIRYSVDTPSWEEGATLQEITVESNNGEPVNFSTVLSISQLAEGEHVIFVQAQSTSNDWGPARAIKFTIDSNAVAEPTAGDGGSNTPLLSLLLLLVAGARRR